MFAFAERSRAGSSPERDTSDERTRGRPRLGVPGVARNAAAYALMLPSMAAGVAMGVLNRDRQTIAEYAVSSWILRMFTLTGVKLRVHGEENLWVSRPAVFVYNHRNNFDPYVAIKLVGRDWGSVAKQEIAVRSQGEVESEYRECLRRLAARPAAHGRRQGRPEPARRCADDAGRFVRRIHEGVQDGDADDCHRHAGEVFHDFVHDGCSDSEGMFQRVQRVRELGEVSAGVSRHRRRRRGRCIAGA